MIFKFYYLEKATKTKGSNTNNTAICGLKYILWLLVRVTNSSGLDVSLGQGQDMASVISAMHLEAMKNPKNERGMGPAALSLIKPGNSETQNKTTEV